MKNEAIITSYGSFPKKLHGHLIEPMVYLPVKSPDWYVTMKYKQHIDKYWKTNASHEIYFRLP